MKSNILLKHSNYAAFSRFHGCSVNNLGLFIVRPKSADKKEDKSITMTIRLERELQEEYDKLSAKSGRSRNELMCMALRYALNNLKFVE